MHFTCNTFIYHFYVLFSYIHAHFAHIFLLSNLNCWSACLTYIFLNAQEEAVLFKAKKTYLHTTHTSTSHIQSNIMKSLQAKKNITYTLCTHTITSHKIIYFNIVIKNTRSVLDKQIPSQQSQQLLLSSNQTTLHTLIVLSTRFSLDREIIALGHWELLPFALLFFIILL